MMYLRQYRQSCQLPLRSARPASLGALKDQELHNLKLALEASRLGKEPFVRGLHRVGDTQIYVSCGTGYWGPPTRLGAPAEITEVILRGRRPMG